MAQHCYKCGRSITRDNQEGICSRRTAAICRVKEYQAMMATKDYGVIPQQYGRRLHDLECIVSGPARWGTKPGTVRGNKCSELYVIEQWYGPNWMQQLHALMASSPESNSHAHSRNLRAEIMRFIHGEMDLLEPTKALIRLGADEQKILAFLRAHSSRRSA